MDLIKAEYGGCVAYATAPAYEVNEGDLIRVEESRKEYGTVISIQRCADEETLKFISSAFHTVPVIESFRKSYDSEGEANA